MSEHEQPGREEETRGRKESESVTQVVVVGDTVNLWGRNSDKWFTSRRWHHRLAPTPRRRAFSFRSHFPLAWNEINWVYRGRDVLVASSRLRTTPYGFTGNVVDFILAPLPVLRRWDNYASFSSYTSGSSMRVRTLYTIIPNFITFWHRNVLNNLVDHCP